MTATTVNLRNGNNIKPLNGVSVTATKPVISTTKTESTSNGHGYDESDLVSGSVMKPHNGFVRQCSKSNGSSEFESQSNRLNTLYSQISAKNGFNHSTISIINPKKTLNGTAKVSNDNHVDCNGLSMVNGNGGMENGMVSDNKTAMSNRIVSNGNGVSNAHDDSVDVEVVSNGNGIPKTKSTGEMIDFNYSAAPSMNIKNTRRLMESQWAQCFCDSSYHKSLHWIFVKVHAKSRAVLSACSFINVATLILTVFALTTLTPLNYFH